jgi:ribosomal protein S18 acetylase RimI-like enzyme
MCRFMMTVGVDDPTSGKFWGNKKQCQAPFFNFLGRRSRYRIFSSCIDSRTSRPCRDLERGRPKAMPSAEGIARSSSYVMQDLSSQAKEKAVAILVTIAALEKKSFPATEVFDFSTSILKKANTRVLFVVSQSAPLSAIAYCVCVRWRRTFLLHKLCVAERFRGQGIGKLLMREVLDRAEQEGCDVLELWVDQSRIIALNLYVRSGLEEQCLVSDYYGPGRTGIKMSIQFSR